MNSLFTPGELRQALKELMGRMVIFSMCLPGGHMEGVFVRSKVFVAKGDEPSFTITIWSVGENFSFTYRVSSVEIIEDDEKGGTTIIVHQGAGEFEFFFTR
ncbi:hypothetical protein C4577_03315 [Candidatus Parcubacteria bacterium]|nr:MAG: hypothetical protein C4577_03315 [Candidatus Parcubacteria bacterium]